jgi:hypothetical protein
MNDEMIEPTMATVARCRARERERLLGLLGRTDIIDGDRRAFLGEPNGDGTPYAGRLSPARIGL